MRSPSTWTSLSIAPVAPDAAEEDDVLVGAADRAVDQPARVLAQPRRLQPGRRRLRVRVRVQRQHLVADEVLDEGERAARRGVVGVHDAARPPNGPSSTVSSPITEARIRSTGARGSSSRDLVGGPRPGSAPTRDRRASVACSAAISARLTACTKCERRRAASSRCRHVAVELEHDASARRAVQVAVRGPPSTATARRAGGRGRRWRAGAGGRRARASTSTAPRTTTNAEWAVAPSAKSGRAGVEPRTCGRSGRASLELLLVEAPEARRARAGTAARRAAGAPGVACGPDVAAEADDAVARRRGSARASTCAAGVARRPRAGSPSARSRPKSPASSTKPSTGSSAVAVAACVVGPLSASSPSSVARAGRSSRPARRLRRARAEQEQPLDRRAGAEQRLARGGREGPQQRRDALDLRRVEPGEDADARGRRRAGRRRRAYVRW